MAPLRWGICAYGLIAGDFVTALSINPDDHVVTAVGGRDEQKAKDFAAKFGAKRALASWQQLVDCDDVDVVYIASLTSLHYEHAKHMLLGGKHVLCEKPMTLSAEQTRELQALAKERRLFLMVAMWTACNPIIQRLRSAVAAGDLGNVAMLQGSFCTPASHVVRMYDIGMGGGGLADLGVYLVYLACCVYNFERPLSICAQGHLFDSGADRAGVLTLRYSGNRMAVLNYSYDCGLFSDGSVIGDKATARLHDNFWCATKLTIDGKVVAEQPSPTAEGKKFFFWDSGWLLYEANHVKECIDKGLAESPLLSHDRCQLIHEIMDEGYRQLGVKYF